ncbi:MAG: hypothetical protein J2P15_01070 [Micromonosporaceae bacterium]|nr:hypothetical protein [Micromonosporaceae bacterium]
MTDTARRRTDQPPVIHGLVAKIESGYGREVKVPPPLLALIVAPGLPVRAAASVLRSATGADPAGRRGWRSLRQGPEFLVTPVLVRDAEQRLVPLEIHGHFSAGALAPGDRIRVEVRWPADPVLPPRAMRIENLTTGRMLTPRGATLWSHLGPGILLQAVLGLALLAMVAACLLGGRI